MPRPPKQIRHPERSSDVHLSKHVRFSEEDSKKGAKRYSKEENEKNSKNDNSPDSASPPEFFFSKLPPELRLRICPVHKFISTTPALLLVNHESRAEDIRHYELSKTNSRFPWKFHDAMNRFYFYPAVDTLCIADGTSLAQQRMFHNHNECGLLSKVQIIAINSDLSMISPYPELKRVVIMHHVTTFAHRCTNYNAPCLVDFDELPSNVDRKGLQDKIEETEKIFREIWDNTLCEKRASTCPEISHVAFCHRRLTSWALLKQEEISRFRQRCRIYGQVE